MRSEERSGIIVVILLLLWGTFVTKPLHLFTDSLYRVTGGAISALGLDEGGIAFSCIIAVLFAFVSVALLLISKTKVGIYIPCLAFSLASAVFIHDLVKNKQFVASHAIVLAVVLSAMAFIYIVSADRVMVWVSDFCILSIDVFLITGLLCKPLGALSDVTSKILYINNGQDVNLTRAFDGALGIPNIVWGLFILVLVILPNIYFCFSRRVD